MVDKILHTKS